MSQLWNVGPVSGPGTLCCSLHKAHFTFSVDLCSKNKEKGSFATEQSLKTWIKQGIERKFWKGANFAKLWASFLLWNECAMHSSNNFNESLSLQVQQEITSDMERGRCVRKSSKCPHAHLGFYDMEEDPAVSHFWNASLRLRLLLGGTSPVTSVYLLPYPQ